MILFVTIAADETIDPHILRMTAPVSNFRVTSAYQILHSRSVAKYGYAAMIFRIIVYLLSTVITAFSKIAVVRGLKTLRERYRQSG